MNRNNREPRNRQTKCHWHWLYNREVHDLLYSTYSFIAKRLASFKCSNSLHSHFFGEIPLGIAQKLRQTTLYEVKYYSHAASRRSCAGVEGEDRDGILNTFLSSSAFLVRMRNFNSIKSFSNLYLNRIKSLSTRQIRALLSIKNSKP